MKKRRIEKKKILTKSQIRKHLISFKKYQDIKKIKVI